jgi:hypothetical protein
LKLIFHLGYSRTGSTFLQTHVFPKHKEINFLGPKNYFNWKDVKINQKTLDKFRDFYLLNTQNNFKDNVVKHFDKKKINIISSENYLTSLNIINDFYDCKYLEDLLQSEELEISFLIVLRNQYDLIYSIYHHRYSKTNIQNLKIKSFEKLINKIDGGLKTSGQSFVLKLFFQQYDFNLIDKKLKRLFKNVKIKYLFYEDLKYNQNIFIDHFSEFLKLDKVYTKNLFDEKKINESRKYNNNHYVINPIKNKIIKNKTFIALKNKFPFKNSLKPYFLKFFLYTKLTKNYDEERLKNIVKEYYKHSNKTFFKNTKLENKFDY